MKKTNYQLLTIMLLLLCAGSPLLSEVHTLSVAVTDASGPSSPVSASGEVQFREELSADNVKTQWSMEAQLTNTSTKTILAYEVSIDASPDYGPGVYHVAHVDYFFRAASPFVPGARDAVSVHNPHWHMAPWKTGGQPAPAKAVFRVLFVEFADGSEFGSSNWGYELPDIRKRTMERLQEAMDAFQDSGEEGLRKALTTARARSDNQGITAAAVNEITEILEAKGSDAAVAKIQERLTAARARGALSPRGGH